jgi:catechol 2,3-dioxygenase
MTFTGINHVGLSVTDMARSVQFYEDVLGLREVGAFPDRSFVALSWGENVHDVALFLGDAGGVAEGGGGRGLHHVAIGLKGGPAELRAFLTEVRAKDVVVRMTLDHRVSQSVYVEDPDGNLIEVFVEMPRHTWAHIPDAMLYGDPLEI